MQVKFSSFHIHFNNVFPSTRGSPEWSYGFRLYGKCCVSACCMSPHVITDLELIDLIIITSWNLKPRWASLCSFLQSVVTSSYLRAQILTWAPCSQTPSHYSSHTLNPRVSLSCRPKNAKSYEFCVLLERKFGEGVPRLTGSKNSQNGIYSLLTAFPNISFILRLLLRRIWRSGTWYARRFGGTCWLCPEDWASIFLLGSEQSSYKWPWELQILHSLDLTLSLLNFTAYLGI